MTSKGQQRWLDCAGANIDARLSRRGSGVWFNRPDSKSGEPNGSGGSNPSLSATFSSSTTARLRNRRPSIETIDWVGLMHAADTTAAYSKTPDLPARLEFLVDAANSFDSRPRSSLRPILHSSHSGNGNPRSSDRAALTLAERLRR